MIKQCIIILSLTGLLMASLNLEAQNRVVLQSNGQTTVFSTTNSLTDAYNAAKDGDTLYLSGIQFTMPSPFNKRLTVFGAGHHPTNSQATGHTIINGFQLGSQAAGSYFEGLYVNSAITFQNNTRIDNVTFKRLNINGSINMDGTVDENKSHNIFISECIFKGLNGRNTRNLRIHNSISNGGIQYLQENAWVANCIITDPYYPLRYIYQSLIENCILQINYHPSYIDVANSNGNTFRKNIFSRNPTTLADNTWENNHINTLAINVVQTWGDPFSYASNYQVVNPTLYQGTTGNQIGVFGGLVPMKENMMPIIPRILSHSIGTATDEAGKLQIQISVEAQDQ